MKVWLIGMALIWTAGCIFAAGVNREVARTPPSVYAAKLAPLLTKWEDVVGGRGAFKDDTSGGIVLLNEDICYRDPDGILYRVEHRAYHAVTQSAVKNIASAVFTFDHERESIFLIDAATILADGTRQPVEASGAFIQTPQRAADRSLYTSSAELNVLFPSVAPGSSVEVVVLIRENTPVIPGEFAASRTFGSAWPCYQQRWVVDLSVNEWEKVRLHTNLPGIPDPARETYADGRERRTWSKTMMARLPWEENSPEYTFCAPTLWLTTLVDWNSIAAWFEGLVADRSDLGAELETSLEGWTKDVKDPSKIIAIIQDKVADDVRYTGLEFGLAGYQPNSCRDIWSRRYGDCKDKANLMRALLARKGIKSHVALLSAGGDGSVERGSPSWLHFNHAILAVEKEGGGYLICDPTAKYLPAGLLPEGDLARDILVLRGKTAEWIRTPDLLAATTAIKADLSMSPDGELSGWFQIDTTGSDAAMYASYYADFDHDELVRNLQRLVEDFFPGAQVMDTDFKTPSGPVDAFRLRAYLLRPSRAATGNTLRFPFPADWLPSVDTNGPRHYSYHAKRRKTVMSVTIALPAGWTASRLPQEFSAPSENAQFSARWSVVDRKLQAELSWWPERASIPATDYVVLQNSIRALKSWLDQPALVSADDTGGTAAAAPASTGPLAGFPIMPTGDGQLRLLAEKFSDGVKDADRRAALEKTLQWFPQDTETVFKAKVLLLELDAEKLGDKVFADKVESLLRTSGTNASPVAHAWAQFVEANARWHATKDPAAVALMKSLAEDKTLPSFRRGWAAYQAGLFISEKDPRSAISFLKSYDRLACEAQPSIIALIATLYSKQGDAAGLRAWAEVVVSSSGSDADGLLKTMIEKLASDWETFPKGTQGSVLNALRKIVPEQFPAATAALVKLRGAAGEADVRREFTSAVREQLQKNPPKWWTAEKDPRFATTAAILQQIKDRNEAVDGGGTLNGIAQLWLHHETDFRTLVLYTRWAMWWLSSRNMDESLLQVVGAQSLKFPPTSSEEVVACWTIYAQYLAQKRDFAEARRLFERILSAPDVRDYQKVEAFGELGKMELAAGRVKEALAAFDRLEPIHLTHRRGVDYLYLAMLVRLERGEFDRALALIASIKKQDTKYINAAANHLVLGHLLKAAEEPEKLKAYWKHAATWRPLWNDILTKYGVAVPTAAQPPAEEDFAALAERVSQAVSAQKPKEFLAAADTYVRLAQWIPIFVNDSASTFNRAGTFSVPLWHSLAECLLAMVRGEPAVTPDADASARMWEAAFLPDLGRRKEGAEKARTLYQDLGDSSKVGQAALRIWAMCARGDADEPQALSALKGLLDGKAEVFGRAETVQIYSDSLLLRGDSGEEHLKLLQRELARTEVSANAGAGKMLAARLKAFQAQREGGASLTRGVNAWIETRGMPWLKLLRPASLDDPKFVSVKGPIVPWQTDFAPPEVLKYDLLLALDERQTAEARETAFKQAVIVLANSQATGDAFAHTILSGVACEGLSAELRRSLGNYGALILLATGLPDLAREVRAGVIKATGKMDNLALDRAEQVVDIMLTRDYGWGPTGFKIVRDNPIDYLNFQLGAQILKTMILSGDVEKAEQLLAGTEGITIDPSLKKSAANVRLDWTRTVRATKMFAPFAKGLLELLLKLPEANEPLPGRLRRQMTLVNWGNITEHECILLCLDYLRRGEIGPDNLYPFFGALSASHVVQTSNRRLGLQILSLALTTPGDDDAKAAWVGFAANLCDPDIPTTRVEAEAQLKKFLDSLEPRALPKTREAIARYRGLVALRTSNEPQPAALFAQADQMHLTQDKLAEMLLRFHFARGNEAECTSIVDRLDADAWASDEVFGAAKVTLERANRADELKLLKETVRERVVRAAAAVWLNPANTHAIYETIQLAVVLGDPSVLSDDWFDYVQRNCQSRIMAESAACVRARLHQDWAALEKSSDVILQAVPDGFDTYYNRALARFHLNEEPGAKQDLALFLSHAMTSADYRDAVELQKQLSKM